MKPVSCICNTCGGHRRLVYVSVWCMSLYGVCLSMVYVSVWCMSLYSSRGLCQSLPFSSNRDPPGGMAPSSPQAPNRCQR